MLPAASRARRSIWSDATERVAVPGPTLPLYRLWSAGTEEVCVALRAVFDDGKRHSEGTVRGMWSSGLVVEGSAAPATGQIVALVVLSGGFDGERLMARVAHVEKGSVMLDLMDLDAARWSRLQALVDGKPPMMALPVDKPVKPPPADAPVFILSGGEDLLGDPTDAMSLPPLDAPVAAVRPAPNSSPKSPFEIPSPLDGPTRSGEGDIEQLIELGRRNTLLAEENARLKQEVARLESQLALKAAVEEELTDALARLESIEKSLRR